MSFLEWRRFNFFELKLDSGNIRIALEGTKVTATSSGHGTLVICDSEGVIHLINRNFQITTFQGYLVTVLLAAQVKGSPILVTVGEDEAGINPLIKVWDLDKIDRQGNPICLKTSRANNANKSATATALSVSDSCNILAVGFSDGTVILHRGDLKRDRSVKQKVLHPDKEPIIGLALKSSNICKNLFVCTTTSVLQYNITIKDKEEAVYLDSAGCNSQCYVLADSIQDSPFMVARDDAVYCYTVDGRGPCYAVEGEKVILQWFRGYVVIVAKRSKETLPSTVTVSSTSSEERQQDKDDSEAYTLTVLDVQSKFIVYSGTFRQIISVLPEWGSLYILTADYKLHQLLEKDLQSKLAILFKKNLYDISIRIAQSHQYDSDSLVDIYRQYGDHLYAKGDHSAAIEQYIKTINKLEPSYVIRKFLDSQHVDNLIKYLSALHKAGAATGDHTTLLLNCYTKLNNVHKLKEFILNKDGEIDFDVSIAISMCRYAASDDALFLAEKYGLHTWYVKILIEDRQKYLTALQYIGKLNFSEAYELISTFGTTLMQKSPAETTEFLKKLCTNYHSSETLLLDQVQDPANHADPQDFIYMFLNDSKRMVEFLEYIIKQSSLNKLSHAIYHTLIDHHLYLWANTSDTTARHQYEQKIIAFLQSSDSCYNQNMALILCSTRNFSPGILYLLEENKRYHQILSYQLTCGNYQGILACCRRFGYQEPSLWTRALWIASDDSYFPPNILSEILTVIEKERLLSPIQVIEILARSQSLNISNVKSYLMSILRAETKTTDDDVTHTDKFEHETNSIRNRVDKILSSPMLFQRPCCSACNNSLELPCIHFLCQHSYHQHCYQAFAENENECPACLQNNQKILGVIKSQEQSRDLHEIFHSQLERSEDGFSVIADYFGRNIFNKIPYFSKQATEKLSQVLLSEKSMSTKRNITVSKYDIKNIAEPSKTVPEVKVDQSIYYNKTVTDKISSLDDNILRRSAINSPTSEESPFAVGSLSNAIENKSSSSSDKQHKNPFEEDDDEYDKSKNPFCEDYDVDADSDYDKNLNPFA